MVPPGITETSGEICNYPSSGYASTTMFKTSKILFKSFLQNKIVLENVEMRLIGFDVSSMVHKAEF